MGKLKNTSTNNAFGEGKEQIYTSDSGKTYRIRNSSLDNVYGTGKEKIITEEPYDSADGIADLLIEIVPWWVWGILVIAALVFQKVCF